MTDLLDLPPGAPLRGTPYRVIKRLGAGGMGALFEAEHVRLKHRVVAIKVLHPGLRGRSEYLARMEREGQTLARLEHPGIVKIFDMGVTDDGIPYFVMERLQGKDLRRILMSKRYLDLTDALGIAEEVLQALAHAHREGIVHRDIKPENIFLAVSEAYTTVKVLDFGIASVADDGRNLTGERFIGTCQYSAPEQACGQKVTEKTDIYAVGCVLFELVCGRRPFPGPTAMEYLRQHANDPAPRLSSYAQIPPALDALVASALEKEEGKRPISALWFASQLHQILQTAENVPLATANTTQEMLLTAVTEGAPSTPLFAAPPVEDTEPAPGPPAEKTLPLAVPARVGTPRMPDAPEIPARASAPVDMRRAATRLSAPPVPRVPTEPMRTDEHYALGGDIGSFARTPAPSVTSRPSSTGEVPSAVGVLGTNSRRAAFAATVGTFAAATLVGGTFLVTRLSQASAEHDTPSANASAQATRAAPSLVATIPAAPSASVSAPAASDSTTTTTSTSGSSTGDVPTARGATPSATAWGRAAAPFVPSSPKIRIPPPPAAPSARPPEPSKSAPPIPTDIVREF